MEKDKRLLDYMRKLDDKDKKQFLNRTSMSKEEILKSQKYMSRKSEKYWNSLINQVKVQKKKKPDSKEQSQTLQLIKEDSIMSKDNLHEELSNNSSPQALDRSLLEVSHHLTSKQRLESEYFFDNKPELKRKITTVDLAKL